MLQHTSESIGLRIGIRPCEGDEDADGEWSSLDLPDRLLILYQASMRSPRCDNSEKYDLQVNSSLVFLVKVQSKMSSKSQ